MTLNKQEQNKLILTAVFAVFSFFSVQYSGVWLDQYTLQQRKLGAQYDKEFVETQRKLADVGNERQLFLTYTGSYINLEEKGIFEQLDLYPIVKQIEDIGAERKFFDVSFDFGENLSSFGGDVSAYLKDSSVNVQTKKMTIQMGMLHDVDIFMLLEDLERNIDRTFIPTSCVFRKTAEFSLSNQPHSTASCTIEWITIADPDKVSTEEDKANA